MTKTVFVGPIYDDSSEQFNAGVASSDRKKVAARIKEIFEKECPNVHWPGALDHNTRIDEVEWLE